MNDTHAAPTADPHRLGKYRLVATLGQGGMGTVYLGLAGGLGEFQKLMVVKELRPDLARKPTFVRMFMDEAKLAARLAHPNVVQTVEAGRVESADGDRYFLAMEYLDGQPLHVVLKRLFEGKGLPLSCHLWILAEVLAGLHYAHELRDYDGNSLHVVHRDVSPQNVFVTYHGEVKVVDFGVAKAANASAMTNPGVFKGKFAYAAPEQTQGRPVDRRCDVFAVGVMLWEALAGRRFARGTPTPEAFEARSKGLEPRIAEAVPAVDPRLAAICDRAMALDPEDRFETADAMRRALLHYLSVACVPVGPSDLATMVGSVFADERRSVQRVIDSALGSRAPAAPGAQPLPALDEISIVSEDNPTTVADLSALVETSRDDEDVDDASPAPPLLAPPPAGADLTPVSDLSPMVDAMRRGRGLPSRALLLGLATVLGALGLWAWGTGGAVEEPAPAAEAPAATGGAAGTDVERPSPQPAAAAAAPGADVQPHRTPRATPTSEASAATAPRSPERATPTRDQGSSSPEPTAEHAARITVPDAPTPPSRPAPVLTVRPKASAAPKMGDELERPAVGRPALDIDTDNPYGD